MSFNAYALVAGVTATSMLALGATLPNLGATANAGATASASTTLDAPKVSFAAPPHMVLGQPFEVTVEAVAGKNGAPLAGWIVSPAAFLVDGVPLGERTNEGLLQLPGGARLSATFDLVPHMDAPAEAFELDFAKGLSESGAIGVTVHRPAPEGLDFMAMEDGELGNYRVLMETNQGYMVLEMWPDRAPNHVKNFLDLVSTGFYDGIIFHRVIEGFMIQGGDPDGNGGGGNSRRVRAEFSDAKHVRGVLSAARTQDPNSATSQFFVMHADNPGLDGRYSAFGMLVDGFDTLDAIATTKCISTSPDPRAGAESPLQRQIIKRAVVVMAPDSGE